MEIALAVAIVVIVAVVKIRYYIQLNEKEKKLIKPSRIFVLKKGAIEDYYDPKIFIDVIKGKYDIELKKEEIEPSIANKLGQILKKKHRDWKARACAKAEIGEEVAQRMSKTDISDEIKRALEKVETHLKLS